MAIVKTNEEGAGRSQRGTLRERFMRKIDKAGEVPAGRPELGPCWLWTAWRNASGYGVISRGGGAGLVLAHRASYELHFGEMPPSGLGVLHRCDVPACVNPEHLFLGTQRDNMADCSRKRRTGQRPLRGETVGNAKLTEAKVLRIHEMAALSQQREIAAAFGVSQTTVWRVLHGKAWGHVAASKKAGADAAGEA